jgi:hypothetical protein
LIWISKGILTVLRTLVFTDDKNNPGIINSRFKRIDSSRLVRLIVPVQKTVTFILTMTGIVALIQNTNYPVKVVDAFGEETLRYWKVT